MKKFIDEFDDDDKVVEEIIKSVPKELIHFIKRSAEITHQIRAIMDEQGLRPKDLSDLLKKKQPEISKLLSGSHNFTLKTLSHIETALGINVINTEVGQDLLQRDYMSYDYMNLKNYLEDSKQKNQYEKIAQPSESDYGKVISLFNFNTIEEGYTTKLVS